MRVSGEERSVGDGVYSRCPKGNYDVVGHTPVSHPEDLLFAWVVHEWVPAWRRVWVLLCSTRCHHGDPSTFAESSVPSAECLTDCREGACARAVCVPGSVCCCAFSLHECGQLRLTAHRQVSRCGYLVLVPKSGGEQ